MKKLVWWFKLLSLTLIFLVCLSFWAIAPVYSRGGGGGGGGCFGSGTLILTPEGDRAIEQLHPGDRVINYDFSTHQQEIGIVGDIEIISSPDYYLIDHHTQVTGTHPFYLKQGKKIKLTKVQSLKPGDRLLDRENSPITISSIEHIFEPISVYNLISVNPNNNFYADGFLVHNKGGGGGGGTFGGGTGGGRSASLSDSAISGLFEAFIILFASLLTVAFWREIYNSILFLGKKFTDDPQLIEFATKINSKFKNKYSAKYLKDDQIWQAIVPPSELEESKYEHRASKTELVAGITHLFHRYQHDWMMKDFDSMTNYILEPFYSRQEQLFRDTCKENFDLIYDCKLSNITPVEFSEKEKEGECIFRVQINGEMVNFLLSTQGYVLSGESYPRPFSELWEMGLDAEQNWYLLDISQVSDK